MKTHVRTKTNIILRRSSVSLISVPRCNYTETYLLPTYCRADEGVEIEVERGHTKPHFGHQLRIITVAKCLDVVVHWAPHNSCTE